MARARPAHAETTGHNRDRSAFREGICSERRQPRSSACWRHAFQTRRRRGRRIRADLTERKRAEEALRESERSLRSAIDGIPGFIASFTPNGELESVNRQVVEYGGQPFEELRNWTTNGTIHPD